MEMDVRPVLWITMYGWVLLVMACESDRTVGLSDDQPGAGTARRAAWSCQMRAKVADYSDVRPGQGSTGQGLMR
jgi:hypothetical protein